MKLLQWIILQSFITISFQNISNTPSKAEKMFNCVTNLHEKTNDNHTLIIFSKQEERNIIWKTTKSQVILDVNNTMFLSAFGKFELYVLLLNNIQQFKKWLNDVYLMSFWNPGGNFIVSISNQENSTEIIEVAWRYFILNINLIVWEDDTAIVYTYYPYKNKCPVDLNPVYFDCEAIPQEVFPEKVPDHFSGCPINLIALRAIPYVINTSSPFKLNVKKSGFEVVIMHEITKHLNLSTVYVPNSFLSWGDKQPNGSYTNMYGLLQKRKVDIVFGLAPGKYTDNQFQSLQNVVYDILTWIVPTADEYPKWTNLMFIYKIDVWLILIVSIIVNGISFWCFGRKFEIIYSFKHLSTCLVNSFSLVLFQGGLRTPKTTTIRILFLFWGFFSVIMYTVHQCKLISILTKPQYKPQINTLTQIIDTKLKIGFFPGSIFSLQGNQYEGYIRARFENCSINEECVNKTAFERNYATLKNRRQLFYFMRQYYTFPNGRPMVYPFSTGSVIMPHFNVLKGYPLAKKFNKIILLLTSNGLVRKWDREIYDKTKIVPKTLTALSINHLLCGFLYLAVGLTIAFITFLCEVIFKKKKQF